jgi:hypothetical protein
LFASAYHVGAAEQNFVARVVDSGWTFWCKLVKLHWHKPPAYLVAPVQGGGSTGAGDRHELSQDDDGILNHELYHDDFGLLLVLLAVLLILLRKGWSVCSPMSRAGS